MGTEKFQNMKITAKGEQRAHVQLNQLKSLWFNTGTLCNLECSNCYIESSPKNDRLSYISVSEVEAYLQEIEEGELGTELIGLTGGEPFLNPQIISILETILKYNKEVLVLTNANRVLKRHQNALLNLKSNYNEKLHLRVSLDHHTEEVHNQEREKGAFARTMDQLKWLYDNEFNISIAGRSLLTEGVNEATQAYQDMPEAWGIHIDLKDKLVIFPEMLSGKELPEITVDCWGILSKKPEDQMCATERMIVKRKGEDKPVVMPCTLLAYDERFILGSNLSDSKKDVYLNHPFCAEFCVLGGASCSSTK